MTTLEAPEIEVTEGELIDDADEDGVDCTVAVGCRVTAALEVGDALGRGEKTVLEEVDDE